jgi:hypothetical protein
MFGNTTPVLRFGCGGSLSKPAAACVCPHRQLALLHSVAKAVSAPAFEHACCILSVVFVRSWTLIQTLAAALS